MFTHCIEEKDRQLTSIMIVNARASKPRAQAGAEGEEVSTRLPHNLFLTNILSIVIISMLLLNQVESVESAIEPDRKEIKRRRPHEKTFRKVTDMQSAKLMIFLPEKVRKFLREAEENGETGDLNSKGGGPADDKCFLCLKVKPIKSEFDVM